LVRYYDRVGKLREDGLVFTDKVVQPFEHLAPGARPRTPPAVAALETLDTPSGIDELLLAREERVALVAQLRVQFRLGGTSGKGVATGASDLGLDVLGMGVGFHSVLQTS
jgi:hypothetical protein